MLNSTSARSKVSWSDFGFRVFFPPVSQAFTGKRSGVTMAKVQVVQIADCFDLGF